MYQKKSRGDDTLAEESSDNEEAHPDARRHSRNRPRTSIDVTQSSEPLLGSNSASSSPRSNSNLQLPPIGSTNSSHTAIDVETVVSLGIDGRATEGRPRNSSVSSVRHSSDTGAASSTGSQDELLNRGWGEAPAYEDDPAGRGGREEMLLGDEPVGASDRRPSRFAQFFSSRNNQRNPTHRPSASSAIGFSGIVPGAAVSASSLHVAQPSVASSNSSTPSSRPGHRATNSLSTLSPFGSSSVSLLLRPVGSRQSVESESARNRLTSPSQLSISGPIATAKTSWVHPSAGLTEQQMKFISYVRAILLTEGSFRPRSMIVSLVC